MAVVLVVETVTEMDELWLLETEALELIEEDEDDEDDEGDEGDEDDEDDEDDEGEDEELKLVDETDELIETEELRVVVVAVVAVVDELEELLLSTKIIESRSETARISSWPSFKKHTPWYLVTPAQPLVVLHLCIHVCKSSVCSLSSTV